jgi:hypothetical protein
VATSQIGLVRVFEPQKARRRRRAQPFGPGFPNEPNVIIQLVEREGEV